MNSWNKVSTPPPKEWADYLASDGEWIGVLTYKHGCWFNGLMRVTGITHWTLLPSKPGDESPSSDPAEVQQLRQWKKEATALLDPILEYGLKHPDIKLGQSATLFVLNRAKSAEVLVKALEEIRDSPVPYNERENLIWIEVARAKATDALQTHEQLKQQ